MRATAILGQRGEQAAAEYLAAQGFRIIARNWRCAEGEIDIVAVERHTLMMADEERTLERARNDKPVVDGVPGSFDEAVVSAVMGLTEH